MTVKIDMEMPTNCNECRLNIFQAFEYKCTALSKKEQETVVLKNIDELWPKPPWTRWWINKDLFFYRSKKPLTV